jgi:hypothetical protein
VTAELSARGTKVLRATLVGISALAIVGPALVVADPPTIVHASKRVKLPAGRVVPQAEVPEVEPVKFVDLSPEDARVLGAEIDELHRLDRSQPGGTAVPLRRRPG